MKEKREYISEIAENLTEKQKKWLIRYIAEISEASYRRAVQQTIVLGEKDSIDDWIYKNDAANYRYDKSLKTSIGLDGFQTTSLKRLLIENHDLNFLSTEDE